MVLPINTPGKTHHEIVNSIRLKVVKLQEVGLLTGDGAKLYQEQLLALLAEVERLREKQEAEAQSWIEKYHFALGRRETYTMFRSLIENMLNAYISRAQTELDHEAELQEEAESRVNTPETLRCDICNRGGFKTRRAVSMHRLKAHDKKKNGSAGGAKPS